MRIRNYFRLGITGLGITGGLLIGAHLVCGMEFAEETSHETQRSGEGLALALSLEPMATEGTAMEGITPPPNAEPLSKEGKGLPLNQELFFDFKPLSFSMDQEKSSFKPLKDSFIYSQRGVDPCALDPAKTVRFEDPIIKTLSLRDSYNPEPTCPQNRVNVTSFGNNEEA